MSSSNLVTGQEAGLRVEGRELVRGRIEKLDGNSLEFTVFPPHSFFPFACGRSEKFVRLGRLWRRMFPDPFVGKPCFSHREPLYTLVFTV